MNAHALNVFDTLDFAKFLEKNDFTNKQAEALASKQKEVITRAIESIDETVATKADLENSRIKIEAKIDTAISQNKAEMLKWFLGSLLAQSAIIVSVIKFL